MDYRNLDLQLSDHVRKNGYEHFRVRVLGSPVGEQRRDLADAVKLPDRLRQRLRTLERGKLNLAEMISLGKELGESLFPPTARKFLERSREKLEEGEGLRIRLRLETYALADLPWEYAYISSLDTPAGQEKASGFLVLDRRTSLVRYEVMGQSPGTLDPVGDDPLRMVVLLADPRVPPYRGLNLDTELHNIQETIKEVPDINLDPYAHATKQILLDAVQKGNAHLFHFAGHGEFQGDQGQAYGTVEGEGYLVLEGSGRADLFDADTLALLLRGRGVRLAVLGACETGRRDGVNAWTGVVPALTKAGIPAVVGNQYRIKDSNAITFSRSFYRALISGESIDAAVTNGRQAILALSGANDRDWGVPVLHLRTEEGVLFPPPPNPDKIVERKPPLPVEVDKSALYRAMVRILTQTDLDVLCAFVQQDLEKDGIDLQVNLEVVGGTSKRSWVLNLIDYLDRRRHLNFLVNRLRQDYSSVMDEYETLL